MVCSVDGHTLIEYFLRCTVLERMVKPKMAVKRRSNSSAISSFIKCHQSDFLLNWLWPRRDVDKISIEIVSVIVQLFLFSERVDTTELLTVTIMG